MSIRLHSTQRAITRQVAARASGDNVIFEGKDGRKYVVVDYLLSPSGAVEFTWKDGDNAISGAISGTTGQPHSDFADNLSGVGYETSRGEELRISLSGATLVGGYITVLETD